MNEFEVSEDGMVYRNVKTSHSYVSAMRGRVFNKKSKTEKYGYIPAKKQIENLMLAGKRLDAYRSGLYLYNAGSFENLSMADEEALKMPFYNDELSLAEKASYMAGLKKSFSEKIATMEADDERRKQTEERFKRLEEAFTGKVAETVKTAQEAEASKAVTGDSKGL